MKTLSALIATLSLFVFAAAAFAGFTHHAHMGDHCTAVSTGSTSNLTEHDMLP
ncbi:MAG: hypothetical protein P1P84_00970 [Deferrisomatales bacterium]|nr:hypothetical protein [Deferrisomatales bacterium]